MLHRSSIQSAYRFLPPFAHSIGLPIPAQTTKEEKRDSCTRNKERATREIWGFPAMFTAILSAVYYIVTNSHEDSVVVGVDRRT
ncbi:hypothetical protein HanHA300_Chr10g0365781 [Helianthus annuus]|nr:hypothetical protein HanHA300_Chr10g0365781 [Helianthus annuus]KAJ0530237.1 hypothetical protein HanHA89_Chr10g0387341 [Helianthus annuus]KAJ0697110.1 hypothetical protein HanLR1_Chr10g0365041 [Helianthus annuus]